MQDSEDFRHIEIIRVFCVISMMWVHVAPGLKAESVVTVGTFFPVGFVLGDILGRASIAALSFVSGMLLVRTSARKSFAAVLTTKARSLLLPMVVWGVVYVAMAVAKEQLTGSPVNGLRGVFDTPLSLINAVAGLTEPTANVALSFIRDLFVTLLILRLCLPVIRRAPALALGAALVVTLFGLASPLVFREQILLFAMAGAVGAARQVSLGKLSEPAVWLPVVVLALAGYGLIAAFWAEPPAPARALLDIFKRLALVFLVIPAACRVGRLRIGPPLASLGQHMYLSYLLHIPLIGVLWVAWGRLIGGPMETSYLLFYLGAPLAAAAVGAGLGQFLAYAPGWMQIMLRGKVRKAKPQSAEPLAG